MRPRPHGSALAPWLHRRWSSAAGVGAMPALLAGLPRVRHRPAPATTCCYQALKSIRTAFVIGTLATVATLPLARGLGILAGYFSGWVDEVIQYLYTVLSSVPNVLLIAACVLMVQVFLDKHPESFETGAERADSSCSCCARCSASPAGPTLCRLLRAETLKLRELEYVQAAHAFGVQPLRASCGATSSPT